MLSKSGILVKQNRTMRQHDTVSNIHINTAYMNTTSKVLHCPKCNKTKSLSNFYKSNFTKSGVSSYCKKCIKIKNEISNKTKEGLTSKIYRGQKISSKRRGHPTPDYSLKEFREWVFSQPKFDEIFKKWENSDFQKDFIPSVDRMSDSLPYSFKNMRIVPFRTNNKKQTDKFIKSLTKSVQVMSMNGKILSTHISIRDCAKNTGFDVSCISRCCNGISKSHKGYKFQFT